MKPLPPGQRARSTFPRFGVPYVMRPLGGPGPDSIRITGALARELEFPVSRLRELPRRSLVADFHCVTGWTVESLSWGGVGFRAFYSEVVAGEGEPLPGVSHLLVRGADGFTATLVLEDALAEDVLLADELGGAPLDEAHGAPVRLLSPRQYAFKSVKHVSAIELHTAEPPVRYSSLVQRIADKALSPHPRARVWEEERHRYLPGWSLRPVYRAIIGLGVRYWNRGA